VRAVDPDAPESVHLMSFPEVDQSKIDSDLSRDMTALLHVVGLGRSSRSAAGVKVRQPLGRVLVGSRQDGATQSIERLKDELLDELNVKEFEVVDNPDDYVSYSVRPNLPLLGPKYGPKLGKVRQAIQSADPARLAQLQRAGRSIPMAVGEETIEIEPDELLVEVRSREGFAVAEDRDFMVALDLEITPELRLEGLARDFVRGIQDARKSAGLQIEDTIATIYEADGEIADAVTQFADYIKGETLSEELVPGEPSNDGAHTEQIKVGTDRVLVGIRKVGQLAGSGAS
jgi:isoleucyl-tRNA synthetase